MHCDFLETQHGDTCSYVCRRCERQVVAACGRQVAAQCRATPVSQDDRDSPFVQPELPCNHRGAIVRTVLCELCGGNKRVIPIYDCSLYGECALSRTKSGNRGEVRQCLVCRDRQPPEDALERLIVEIGGPFRQRPSGWNTRPDVHAAHKELFARKAKEHLSLDYPGGYEGRGIVTSGGGAKYFICAYVLVRVLRQLGCTLPVEWWHIGRAEMDPYMRRLAEGLGGVTVRDCREVQPQPRILGGWTSKVVSIYHSRFREVLYLDADQVPVRDPSFLFDEPQYQRHGAVFWPDLRNGPGYDITAEGFDACGLPAPGKSRLPHHDKPSDYRPVESGQVLIDKSKVWTELTHCLYLNEHEDFFYPSPSGKRPWLCYGDKSLWLLAWMQIHKERVREVSYYRPPYAMPADCAWIGSRKGGAFLQRDFSGQVLFQHRVQPTTKWDLHGVNHHPAGFTHVEKCNEAIAELRSRWNGKVYQGDYPDPPAGFHCRMDVADITMYQSVIYENEYRLPDKLPSGSVIVDVGAHVGSFAWAAITRGAGQVHAVEPQAENYAYLWKNLGSDARLVPYRMALWRSDRPIARGRLASDEGKWRNVNWSVLGQEGDAVTLFPFDQFLDVVTWGGQRRVHTLKLDCEGSEWPILFTSRRMHLIDHIVGEWHLAPFVDRTPAAESLVDGVTYSRESLRAHLETAGFTVEIIDNPDNDLLGWFFATR